MFTVEVKYNGEWKEVDSGETFQEVISTVNLFAAGWGEDCVRIKRDGKEM